MSIKSFLKWFAVIWAFAVSMASTIFMVLTFYDEGILGHGITFIEPNLFIARSELTVVTIGLALTLGMFVRMLRKD